MHKPKNDEVYNRNIGVQRLKSLVERLRDPENGCPWDIEQNSESIARYCIEEAHELQHAISLNKKDAIKNVDILFKREMVTKAYVPKLLNAHLQRV